VNTSTFNPGDSILFESTCTWREQLTVPSSGSAGSPITFGVYGTGAQPIISGADLLTSWASEAPWYYAPVAAQPNQVFRDNQRLTLAASQAALATGQWWWDSTNSRVYAYDDPSGHTMEASQRDCAIYIPYGYSYVTVSNVETDKAQTYNFYANASYVVASSIISKQAFQVGIRFEKVSNGTISSCTVAYNGSDGIFFYDSPSLLIDQNIVYDNDQLTNDVYSAGIHASDDDRSSTNFIIQRNSVYSNGIGHSGWQIGAGIWPDTVGTGGIIRYNLVYSNNFAGIYLDADNGETVFGNVVYNNGVAGSLSWGAVGIMANADGNTTLTNTILNNTAYGNYYGGIRVNGPSPEQVGGCTNNIVENNISTSTVSGPNLTAQNGCENPGTNGSGNVYAYNAFGPAASNFIEWGAGAYESTYTAWETATGNCGTTGCSHSVQAAPAFANASAGQLWLTSGSPGIDAGTNLGSPYNIGLLPGSSWPNSVLTGDQNSYGIGWEVGAYIFTGQTGSAATPRASL
jgi:parallel beta-helix repeat protein